jgi:hypothetical protein
MKRPQVMGHHGKWPRRLLRFWQEWDGTAIEVYTETGGPWEITLPTWPWRWVCWISGHADSSYGYCCVCRKTLK